MKVDILIIGQGLAGTLLHHFLDKAGVNCLVCDPDGAHSASRRAAGLINPVTGRYFVKSWRIDELLPFARKTYRALELQLQASFYHERSILRALGSAKEENDWLARAGDAGYQLYMGEPACMEDVQHLFQPVLAYGQTLQSAQLNVPFFLQHYQQYLAEKNLLRRHYFHYESLEIAPDKVSYEDIEAKQVVFCEGYGGVNNPFFNYLPFRGDKGEVLIVKIPGAGLRHIVKQNNIFLVPLEGDLYWLGATYAWAFKDDLPSEQARQELMDRLQSVIKLPFEVIDHWAAVRPTVKDRRPFLGQHAEFSPLWIFNGLGTKGSSLAPFWAHHLSEVLLTGKSIDPEVDIQRFNTSKSLKS